LVDNAVKFTPEGGRVEIALLRGNAESIVRIKDTARESASTERDIVCSVLSIRQTEKRARVRSWPQSCSRDSQASRLSFDYSSRLGCVIEIASRINEPMAKSSRSVEIASTCCRAEDALTESIVNVSARLAC